MIKKIRNYKFEIIYICFLFLFLSPINPPEASEHSYTIQTGAYKQLNSAQNGFAILLGYFDEDQLDHLRIEMAGDYYKVRIGLADERESLEALLADVSYIFPEAIIVKISGKEKILEEVTPETEASSSDREDFSRTETPSPEESSRDDEKMPTVEAGEVTNVSADGIDEKHGETEISDIGLLNKKENNETSGNNAGATETFQNGLFYTIQAGTFRQQDSAVKAFKSLSDHLGKTPYEDLRIVSTGSSFALRLGKADDKNVLNEMLVNVRGDIPDAFIVKSNGRGRIYETGSNSIQSTPLSLTAEVLETEGKTESPASGVNEEAPEKEKALKTIEALSTDMLKSDIPLKSNQLSDRSEETTLPVTGGAKTATEVTNIVIPEEKDNNITATQSGATGVTETLGGGLFYTIQAGTFTKQASAKKAFHSLSDYLKKTAFEDLRVVGTGGSYALRLSKAADRSALEEMLGNVRGKIPDALIVRSNGKGKVYETASNRVQKTLQSLAGETSEIDDNRGNMGSDTIKGTTPEEVSNLSNEETPLEPVTSGMISESDLTSEKSENIPPPVEDILLSSQTAPGINESISNNNNTIPKSKTETAKNEFEGTINNNGESPNSNDTGHKEGNGLSGIWNKVKLYNYNYFLFISSLVVPVLLLLYLRRRRGATADREVRQINDSFVQQECRDADADLLTEGVSDKSGNNGFHVAEEDHRDNNRNGHEDNVKENLEQSRSDEFVPITTNEYHDDNGNGFSNSLSEELHEEKGNVAALLSPDEHHENDDNGFADAFMEKHHEEKSDLLTMSNTDESCHDNGNGNGSSDLQVEESQAEESNSTALLTSEAHRNDKDNVYSDSFLEEFEEKESGVTALLVSDEHRGDKDGGYPDSLLTGHSEDESNEPYILIDDEQRSDNNNGGNGFSAHGHNNGGNNGHDESSPEEQADEKRNGSSATTAEEHMEAVEESSTAVNNEQQDNRNEDVSTDIVGDEDFYCREPGSLSNEIKPIIMRNKGELSSIEGNILSNSNNKQVKTILVTSSSRGEGKTFSAVSLAYSLSKMANTKVVLVDGNLHTPKIHELFNIDVSPGLSDLCLNGANGYEVFRETEFENLSVLPRGKRIDNTLEVFRGQSFREKLRQLKNQYDYVIVDGHSVLESSDTSMIAKFFDGIILVVECEKTKWQVVNLVKEKITNTGGEFLGVVLNKRKYYIPKILYGKI